MPSSPPAPLSDGQALSVPAERATATVTLSGNVSDGDSVTVEGTAYTWKTTPASSGHIQIGGDAATSLTNLGDAVNFGGDYVSASAEVEVQSVTATVLTLQARAAGTAGNAYTLAKSGANITISGATFSGGTAATEPTAPRTPLSDGQSASPSSPPAAQGDGQGASPSSPPAPLSDGQGASPSSPPGPLGDGQGASPSSPPAPQADGQNGTLARKTLTINVEGPPLEGENFEIELEGMNNVYTFRASPTVDGDIDRTLGAADLADAIADEINGDGSGPASTIVTAESDGVNSVALTAIIAGTPGAFDVSVTSGSGAITDTEGSMTLASPSAPLSDGQSASPSSPPQPRS